MTTTYTLVCDDCGAKHWAGQSRRLYDSAARFLLDHIGHRVRFLIDDDWGDDPADKYADIEYSPQPPPGYCGAMKTVFVVSAAVAHEGSSPVRAFERKEDADAFETECDIYQNTMPQYPGGGGFGAGSHEARAEYRAKVKAWEEAHPAGASGSTADYFNVTEVPFVTSPAKSGS